MRIYFLIYQVKLAEHVTLSSSLIIIISSEHVTRQHSDVTPRPEAEPQVSFDSFTLVLEADDSEDEVIPGPDVDMREGFKLCPEKSSLKNKRKQNVESSDVIIT